MILPGSLVTVESVDGSSRLWGGHLSVTPKEKETGKILLFIGLSYLIKDSSL